MNNKLVKFFLLSFFVILTIISGCAKDIIISDSRYDSSSYSMYGQNPGRIFFVPVAISDSFKLLWQNEIHGSLLSSSIITFDKYVFISDKAGRIYAFDMNDGKENGYLNYKGFVSASSVINQFKLLFPVSIPKDNKSVIHFYDIHLGKEISSIEIEGVVTGDILKLEDGFFVMTEQGKVFKIGLNATKIWEYNHENFIHTFAASDNKVIIFGDDKGFITALDSYKGTLLYKKQFGGRFESGIAIEGDTAYTGNFNGNLFAINLNTGSELWKFETKGQINVFPVIDEKYIYIGNLNGNIFKLSRLNGKLLWQLKTDGIINVTPLIFNNRLIQPDLNNKIYFINTVTGSIIKTIDFENRPVLTPVYFNNKLFLGTDYGQIFVYEFIQ
jgi:outer membrane protein assembly factor BamB